MDGERERRQTEGTRPRTGRPATRRPPTGLGLQFALAILVFTFVGQWLDRRLGTEPWLLLVGVFSGAGAASTASDRR